MAAEQEKDGAEGAEGTTEKKKVNLKGLILVGGWAVAQALIIVVVIWLVRGTSEKPVTAEASASENLQQEMVLVPVLPNDAEGKIRAVNAQRGGQIVYWSIQVSVRVPKAQSDTVRQKLVANQDLVKQEITTVVGAANPDTLEQEADHATLKRQITYALNSILGKNTISEVVIPECLPARMD